MKYVLISAGVILTFIGSVSAMDQYNGFIICPKLDRNLKYGDTDATTNGAVTQLQVFLDSYHGRGGLQGLAGVGRFGPKTEAEIKSFQKENGLEGLGMVGPKTRALMQKKCTKTN